MSLQLFPTNFPTTNTPIVNASGAMSNPGMSFFRALFNRTGQDSGSQFATANNLVATGATQATALLLQADWNNITNAGTFGVRLPALTEGQQVWVFNNDPLNQLLIYPPSGASITYIGVNAGINNPVTLSAANIFAAFYFSDTEIVAA